MLNVVLIVVSLLLGPLCVTVMAPPPHYNN